MTIDLTRIVGQSNRAAGRGGVSPAFRGAAEVLELLGILCRRPRRGELPGRRFERLPRGRYGLPLVYVVRPTGSAVLPALAGHLAGARPGRIPHALVACDTVAADGGQPDRDGDPADGAADPEREATLQVAEILFQLARRLGGTLNARYGRIRFHRFGLARWLLLQDVRGEEADPDRVLLRRLRGRAIAQHRLGGSGDRLLAVTSNTASTWMNLLLLVIPPLWFLVKTSGRIPVIGQPYRWLLRQPYLAPRDPGTFIGFADRLTVGGSVDEDQEQIRKLLVNAFLEDLRSAYRRRLWRPRGARRTTYPVALLDDVTRDNGGYRLLKLVNDVRSETGSFDPLLIISGSQRVPPSAADPIVNADAEPLWPADQALDGYRQWCEQFAVDSRNRKPAAWYLPLEVTAEPAARDGADPAGRPERAPVPPRLVVPRAPLWARRWAQALALVTLIGALAGGGTLWHQWARNGAIDWAAMHCGQSQEVAGAELLHGEPGRCYGISDGSYLFSGDDGVRKVEQVIHLQNQALNSNLPVVSVVYLAALDATSPTNAWQEMAGVAAAQRAHNDNQRVRVQIKVLIANGGVSMEHGLPTATEIGALARKDRSVVGVLGLSQSRTPTQETIQELGRMGLPVVASTLSADQLVEKSPLYFQVSPQNRREAAVAARYAAGVMNKEPGVSRELTIVQSNDADDIYSSNLADDVEQSFQQLSGGYKINARLFHAVNPPSKRQVSTSDQTVADLGANLCGNHGVVFFTGRPDDFDGFLSGVKGRCGSNPPRILGGDDISRYVAEPMDRTRYGVRFSYLSFAVGKTTCNSAGLYRNLREIAPEMCSPDRLDPSLDGHASLAYDAASIMIKAVDSLYERGVPATPGAVWHQLATIKAPNTFDGETGTIDFNGSVDGQYMTDKAVAVMTVDGNGQPSQVGVCGRRTEPQAVWC